MPDQMPHAARPPEGTASAGPSSDAAPAAGAPDGLTGRARLSRALRRPGSRNQITAAVLLAVLGFAAVVQVRATDRDDTYAGASQQDLIQLINSLSLATDRTRKQISELEETRDALRSDAVASRTALEVARRQAESLAILTGTAPAVGPGVEVTVDGPPGSVGTEQLLNGLQELRAAGAEAIELNGEVRVVAQTWISEGPGDSVVVDGREVELPFVIKAIGPKDMATAVYFAEGFADDVRRVGGDVQVKELDQLTISTTRSLSTPQYAEPAS